MGQEFNDQDLSDAVFWGVDLSRSHFRDVNFANTTMKNVWMINVDLDGIVDRLVVNGVDVTDYVNARDPWQPLRGMLRPTDRAGLLAAWTELERVWASLIERAGQLTDAQRRQSVDGEWSIMQTLRHLVLVMDKWVTVPLNNGSLHPIGIPNTDSADHPWPGLDPDADPSFAETLAVRAERAAQFGEFLRAIATTDDIACEVEVPDNGIATVIECIYTVFEEELEHHRCAQRDLTQLESHR